MAASNRRETLVAWLIGLALAAGVLSGSKLIDSTNQIQQERYDSVYTTCVAQDARNTNTVAQLHKGPGAKAEAASLETLFQGVGVNITPQGHAALMQWSEDQAKAGVVSTTLLIDDLAPYVKDCAAKARATTH